MAGSRDKVETLNSGKMEKETQPKWMAEGWCVFRSTSPAPHEVNLLTGAGSSGIGAAIPGERPLWLHR
jgi:hypothetical protein